MERLRDALKRYFHEGNWQANFWSPTDEADQHLTNVIAETPSTSLQQHDNEVIERCAVAAEMNPGNAYTKNRMVEAIRALKTEV